MHTSWLWKPDSRVQRLACIFLVLLHPLFPGSLALRGVGKISVRPSEELETVIGNNVLSTSFEFISIGLNPFELWDRIALTSLSLFALPVTKTIHFGSEWWDRLVFTTILRLFSDIVTRKQMGWIKGRWVIKVRSFLWYPELDSSLVLLIMSYLHNLSRLNPSRSC